ncbi:MAG: MBL fold metallo-hydrolase [Desulfobacterales bacterium]
MDSKFFLETIRSEGLAQLSYVVGHQGRAAVIDPRRDVGVYVETARKYGAAVTHIFETHRNEDFVSGAQMLSRLTGASVYHGRALDFEFGQDVSDGASFDLGDMRLEVIETPGHTDESISIALYDRSFGDAPVAVFTGDTLFIGDVGRTDFYPGRDEEVAGNLFDSIFEKLLPLGDQTILYPAHGAGSVCGAGMAAREFSTLGYERRFNPRLKMTDRQAFIRFKVEEHHYKPPYFKQMELLNLEGTTFPYPDPRSPVPLSPSDFHDRMQRGMTAIDIRSPEAIGGATVPGSIGIPLNMLASFAGWFLRHEQPLGIVAENFGEVNQAVRHLARIGYEDVDGYLEGGLTSWETGGFPYDRIPAVHARELVEWIQEKQDFVLLDVRGITEFEEERLPGAQHVYVGELPGAIDTLDRRRPIVTFCGSGQRAIIAASLLKGNGFESVSCCLGSLAACKVVGCPIVESED